MPMTSSQGSMAAHPGSSIETPYSWTRLVVCVVLGTLGCVGLWSTVVALPAVQADFGIQRAGASLPYTLTTLGFMAGGIAVGRLADRFGILPPFAGATILMGGGYIASAFAPTLPVFAIVGVAIGLGSAASFAPLVADVSLWFDRQRGLAISLATAGTSIAGVVWPPILQRAIAEVGWRQTHVGVGVFCLATMLPLSLLLRRRPVLGTSIAQPAAGPEVAPSIGLAPNMIHALLTVAGLCCCVAMAMPQVHIVAYCVDLGYGPARGAEMLSVMFACGVASRLVFGWVLNRIGGLSTLVLCSTLQAIALVLYLPFDGLVSLYVVSAVFGLTQGGLVSSYAVIIRELFPAREAGLRVSLAISTTLAGMALGGWMAGAIYDGTGSYRAALMNGIAWNLANMAIIGGLLWCQRPRAPAQRQPGVGRVVP
jgi:MFS family permease